MDFVLNENFYFGAVKVGFGVAFFAFVGSLFLDSPYGRFASNSFGIEMNPKLGWWLMEIMATVSFLFFYPLGPNFRKPIPAAFALLFVIHYVNRGWYFPLNMRVTPGSKSSFSILVVVSGFFVTSLHGYLNAMWYSKFCTFLDWDWIKSPVCIFGLVLYESSFIATLYSEKIMRNLRDLNPAMNSIQERYKIPRGFLFELVSSPQYFTELTGFLGWAIMTKNPAGLVIFLISCANLIPRAFSTHKWYRSKFDDYPVHRKALVPYVI